MPTGFSHGLLFGNCHLCMSFMWFKLTAAGICFEYYIITVLTQLI